MRRTSATIDALSRLLCGALLISLAACTHLPLPRLVVVVPTPIDLSAWPDDEQLCVAVPPGRAVYLKQLCLSVGTIRALILASRVADRSSSLPGATE
jgi:hypothetical protein